MRYFYLNKAGWTPSLLKKEINKVIKPRPSHLIFKNITTSLLWQLNESLVWIYSIDKSIGGGTKDCQTLHMTKFEIRFEFLAGKIGLCDSKHTLSCQTCEKIPKIVNIYFKVPKFSRQTRLIAKLNSWKEIWISRLEPPPYPICRQLPVHTSWTSLLSTYKPSVKWTPMHVRRGGAGYVGGGKWVAWWWPEVYWWPECWQTELIRRRTLWVADTIISNSIHRLMNTPGTECVMLGNAGHSDFPNLRLSDVVNNFRLQTG